MLYVYVATFLLIGGVFCFIYASFPLRVSKPSYKPPKKKNRKQRYQKTQNYQKPAPQKPKSDAKIIKDRRLDNLTNIYPDSHLYVKDKEYSNQQVEGLLYLDYLKSIPYQNHNIKQIELKHEMFRMLRRIGKATLKEHTNGFVVFSQNSQYNYDLPDINAVLFYDEAFLIVPNKSDYPLAIFLTPNVEEFKNILEKRT